MTKETAKNVYSSKNPFPFILHDLLEDAERFGNQSIVSWSPDGLSFQIHDKQLFLDIILPRYFRLTHLKSFKRQMQLYEFESDGKNACK
jgi:hypothetical protein